MGIIFFLICGTSNSFFELGIPKTLYDKGMVDLLKAMGYIGAAAYFLFPLYIPIFGWVIRGYINSDKSALWVAKVIGITIIQYFLLECMGVTVTMT